MNKSSLWTKLQKLWLRKPGSLLGVDISTGAIKVAEIKWRQEQPVLKGLGIAELPETIFEDGQLIDSDALTNVLRQLIHTSGITSREAVIAVGGRTVFMREVTFPKMADNELREAVKWDMEKYVPYEPDSYYYDFAVLGESKDQLELRVLLMAAPKESIDQLVAAFKNAGIKLVAIDVEAIALSRILPDVDNSIVVDIGKFVSQIMVFQNGVPAVTRTIPICGQRFTDAIMNVLELEQNEAESLKLRQKGLLQRVDSYGEHTELHGQMELLVTELEREIRRTIEFYQIQNREALVQNIFLTGGGANLDNLPQHLTAQLGQPVIFNNPIDILEIGASFDKQYVRDISPRLAVAIGLALRGGAT